ncbi:hypothetical protein GOODEAATRI_018685 [Goodea atripinnis]|uniref:Uncharacterized protein n=1 Tax=Goodea atripinnis TaxID=208336 RepID=A0ABV0PQ10_9TELE
MKSHLLSNLKGTPKTIEFCDIFVVLHCDAVGSTVALQQEGLRFDSRTRSFCIEFVCFPLACMGSPWVLRVPPQSKNITVKLIGLSQVPLGLMGCVHGCLSCVSLCCPVMDW